jgi:predicted branched-subunit amino acid permease
MKSAFFRTIPVGLALTPVGLLFGILAAQAKWSAADVFLLSVIGFTGSGQFAFLGFTQQGGETIGLSVIFMIILSMNLRYIPMSLSASQPLKASTFHKTILSHCLADESYAMERQSDDLRSRTAIRISIFLFWILSTVAGCAFAALLPNSITNELTGLTFPVSAILFALSLMNVITYIKHDMARAGRWSTIGPLLSLAAAITLVEILGERYFWLPSIFASYFILRWVRKAASS